METSNTQQEIVLVTNTGFTSRQYHEKDTTDSSRNLSEREKLQEACWNGLVQEKLPEIFIPQEESAKMYLWQLREANNILTLEIGEFPTAVDSLYSIDPYAFIGWLGEN